MFLLFCFFLLVIFLKVFHLLSFFISLEMVGLLVLFCFVFLFNSKMSDQWVMVYFICLLGCESALGLVLFVLFTRTLSKDYFYSLGVLKF